MGVADFLPPCFLEPFLAPKVWGGRKLASLFDKPLPGGDERLYGESWEVADLPEGRSRLASGPGRGLLLGEAVDRWGQSLVGTSVASGPFPLLVKILDAARDLSIQVHPGEVDLARFPGARSKDESWLILSAEKGGSVLHGLRPGTSAEDFRRSLKNGGVVESIRRVPVAAGDVIRVRPGTVHAICGGVVLLEVQQPSDTTFRVWDYGRAGLDGKLRDLHVEEAISVMDFSPEPPPAKLVPEVRRVAAGEVALLVDAPGYRLERLRPSGRCSWMSDPRSFQVLFAHHGEARLGFEGGELELRRGATVLVPAVAGRLTLEPSGVTECEILFAGLGGEPLLSLGSS